MTREASCEDGDGEAEWGCEEERTEEEKEKEVAALVAVVVVGLPLGCRVEAASKGRARAERRGGEVKRRKAKENRIVVGGFELGN